MKKADKNRIELLESVYNKTFDYGRLTQYEVGIDYDSWLQLTYYETGITYETWLELERVIDNGKTDMYNISEGIYIPIGYRLSGQSYIEWLIFHINNKRMFDKIRGK